MTSRLLFSTGKGCLNYVLEWENSWKPSVKMMHPICPYKSFCRWRLRLSDIISLPTMSPVNLHLAALSSCTHTHTHCTLHAALQGQYLSRVKSNLWVCQNVRGKDRTIKIQNKSRGFWSHAEKATTNILKRTQSKCHTSTCIQLCSQAK